MSRWLKPGGLFASLPPATVPCAEEGGGTKSLILKTIYHYILILIKLLVASLQWISQERRVRPTTKGKTDLDSRLLKAFTKAADVVESGSAFH